MSNEGRMPNGEMSDESSRPTALVLSSAQVSSHAAPRAGRFSTLVHRLAEELGRRWQAGERPVVEEYLDRHPELWRQPEAAVELIYEELCLRQEYGEERAVPDVLARFPEWREQLQVILNCHRFLESGTGCWFPSAGENLGDFHLLAELGRGAHGRVFLATQPMLGDRLVVVKLTPRWGDEHLSLARLQHTHIVPLYAVHEDPVRDLRVLCMPYFGGAPLAQVLEQLRRQQPPRRTGRQILELLRVAQAAAPVSLPVEGPACGFLARASYVQAICWLGICLGDALQYTHERGLVHLDLKPANVLWGADGQPMLLDLHLARAPIAAGAPAPAWLGGTPAYMAREQRLALDAVRTGRTVPASVDRRADIYALGLLLWEALAGELPSGAPSAAWLRQRNPHVSVGLADILAKCVAEEPHARYAEAAGLAADLRRDLADLPLGGVSKRRLPDRARQWRRCRRYAAVFIGLLLAGAALLAMTNRFPFQRGPNEGTHVERHRVETARQLHLIAEQLRTILAVRGEKTADIQVLESLCRGFWHKREVIAQQLAVWPNKEQARDDFLDLIVLWTDLRLYLAGKEDEIKNVRKEALAVLDQAEKLFGPSCVLDRERRLHAAEVGLKMGEARAPLPRTTWEHFAVGRTDLRAGDLEAAAVQFEEALALEPQSFWPNFYQGTCAYRRGCYEDAVLAFTACIVLAPDKGWCYYNRGLAYEGTDRPERALRDYDRALQLAPALPMPRVNQAMFHGKKKT
jgi:serine/threonine protein kinase